MSLVKRRIDIKFITGAKAATFNDSGLNTLSLKGLRVNAKIVKAGSPSYGSLTATIYGMTLSHMNTLMTLGQQIQQIPDELHNSISVSAGDDNIGMHEIYLGEVTNAYSDFNAAPNVAFYVESLVEYSEYAKTTDPITRLPGTKVADIAKTIADKMKLTFENSGVKTVTSGHTYLDGAPMAQLQKLMRVNHVMWIIDKGTLAICPFFGSRNTDVIPKVSRKTGLIGYPTYAQASINVRSIFRPDIQFNSLISVESDLKGATREWTVMAMDYELQSEAPHGLWQLAMTCYDPKLGQKIAGKVLSNG